MQLLFSALSILPLIALRLGYAIAYLQLTISHPSSGFLKSTAVLVCLSVVPEMICIGILLLGGLVTRSLKGDIQKRDKMVANSLEGTPL